MGNGIYGAMIELQILNYVYQTNSIQVFILNGITQEYFTTYREHYNFIIQFYNEYNSLPSRETFQAKFSDNFDWITVTDPEDYLVKKLKEAKLYRDLIGSFKDLGNLIKDEKSDEAVALMSELSQKFIQTKQSNCIDLIDNAKLRYDSYIDRVENPERSYVTTGLKELDDILGGWDLKNESALVCARTGFGKSWWLIYFALAAAKAGLRVGFYSGEMELDLVGYRLDTFLGNIANGSLTHGNENVREEYTDYVESLSKVIKGHIFCITPDMFDGSVTVSKLRAFIEKENLDMLCIDQFSLLDDQKRARTPREQAVNISKDLRALQRLKKIPIIIAVQLNREEYEEGPNTRNIAESDRIGQDCTTALFIERKGDNVVLTIGKARNAKTGDKLTYAWNINMGTLHYIPSEEDARQGNGSEDLLSEYNDTARSDMVF